MNLRDNCLMLTTDLNKINHKAFDENETYKLIELPKEIYKTKIIFPDAEFYEEDHANWYYRLKK